jgi:UDP-GlcNAc:undecaprenyl-phosphate GlcNAc-1-phosphate transferase
MSAAMAGFLIPFLAAGAAGVLFTPLVRRLALRTRVVARPKADRWHREAVPLLGGVAIWLATMLAFLVVGVRGGAVFMPAILAGSTMFVVGLVDDLRPLKPSTKLIAQIATICGVLMLVPAPHWLGVPTLDVLITILWFVGITNAFNLLDNMDGLCAGIAAIAAVALALNVEGAHPGVLACSAALAGAAAAFLVFNFNPASIFMGDSGSMYLGSTLAVLATMGTPRAHAGLLSTLAAPVVLMLLPIFDIVFVTVSRKLSARAASVGGRDHTSHRLVAMGFSERQAVVLLWALAALGGGTTLVVARAHVAEANLAVGVLVVAVVLFGVRLARVRVYGEQDFAALRNRPFTPLLVDVTYRRRIFEVLLDLALTAMAYYAAYVIRFDAEFPLHYHLFTQSLPIVIGCQLGSFVVVGVYHGVWRYFSAADLRTYVKGVGLGVITSIIALVYLYRFEGYSRGVFMIDAMALLLLVAGSRASFRILGEWASSHRRVGQRALIYGAGDGGALVVRELRNNASYGYDPIGFIDDDSSKRGRRIMGLRVLGGIEELPRIIPEHRAELVILSTGKLADRVLATLRTICYDSGTKLLQLDFRLDNVLPEQPRSARRD